MKKQEYNYPLRIPIKIKEVLRKRATEHKWSLNTYIVHVLEKELKSPAK